MRIVAGSPSQGSIAVEEVSAPEAGTDIEVSSVSSDDREMHKIMVTNVPL